MYDLIFKKRKECVVFLKKIFFGLFILEEILDFVDFLYKEVVCQIYIYKYYKCFIKVKNIIFIFCIYVEMVIIMISIIRRVGFIVFVIMCKNFLDFIEVEVYGFFIKLN